MVPKKIPEGQKQKKIVRNGQKQTETDREDGGKKTFEKIARRGDRHTDTQTDTQTDIATYRLSEKPQWQKQPCSI